MEETAGTVVTTQEFPQLRRGQRVSIVVAGETKLHDMGRITYLMAQKGKIHVRTDSTGAEVGFVFLEKYSQWRHFFPTDRGDWAPGISLDPDKEVRYLIEGID